MNWKTFFNMLRDNDLTRGWKQYRQMMKGLPFKEKVSHTFYSYKLELCAIAFLLGVLWFVGLSVVNANTNIVLGGDVMNVSLSEEGFQYISDDYFESLGLRSFLNKLQVVESYYALSDNGDYEYNQTVHNQTVALVSAERLDFQIASKGAMEMFLSEGIYMDLRKFFTEEELARWEGKILYVQYEETGEMVPMALDISGIPFIETYYEGKEDVFFMVIFNTPRKEQLRHFYEYIMAWEPKENTVTTAPAA